MTNEPQITESQRYAIIAIWGRLYGRHEREARLLAKLGKPLAEMTRSEASSLIEEIGAKLREKEGHNTERI